MMARDFVKFLETVSKMQKKNNSHERCDNDSLTNGVYFVQYENDIILIGLDGRTMFWEKFAVVDKKQKLVGYLGLDDFTKACQDSMFPCKATWNDVDDFLRMTKGKLNSAGRVGFDAINYSDDKEAVMSLAFANSGVFKLSVRPIAADVVVSLVDNLYRRYVLHDPELVGDNQRPAQCGVAHHAIGSLSYALAWLSKHEFAYATLCIACYETRQDKNSEFSSTFSTITVPDNDCCGVVAMLCK